MSFLITLLWIAGILFTLWLCGSIAYSFRFKQVADAYLAQFENEGTERLVIRTDGLWPHLGEKPPERSMWRVRTSMFFYKGNLMCSYAYNPDQLENADLDYHENIEAEIRGMEAHGQAILDAKAGRES